MTWGLFSFLVGWKQKLKIFCLAVATAAVYAVYAFGKNEGKKKEITKRLVLQKGIARQSLEQERKIAKFYKDMEKAGNEFETTRPYDRDDLIKRLRESGL